MGPHGSGDSEANSFFNSLASTSLRRGWMGSRAQFSAISKVVCLLGPAFLPSPLWTLQQVQIRGHGACNLAFLVYAVTTTLSGEEDRMRRMWDRKWLWPRQDTSFSVHKWIYNKSSCSSFLGNTGIMRNQKSFFELWYAEIYIKTISLSLVKFLFVHLSLVIKHLRTVYGRVGGKQQKMSNCTQKEEMQITAEIV